VAAALLLSCGGGGSSAAPTPGPTPTPPPANTFFVGGNSGDGYGGPGDPLLSFAPANLTIAAGTTVTWVWKSGGHSLDSGPGCSTNNQFTSGGLQNTGFTMTHTFSTPGTYPFFCGVHCGSNMKGTITVQ
jgi:plastocyanin